ncbi:MAG: ribbon-helix-helix protein, CopG family [Nitratireductor sp.]|nr:ribbon-helix-helix protein, CopG family [Nitratireductor sp.]
MLALRLPKDIEERLDALAKKTGRTKSTIAREAILEHLEDIEDIAEAEARLREAGETIGWEEVRVRLFSDDGQQAAE